MADTGGLNQFGFAGAPTQAATTAWTDLFNYINKHGGVDGRSLVPDFVYYNALDYNSMESACLKWTVDDKVFAVINSGGLYGPPVLCVSRDHKTPFMTNDQEDASYFNASNGMLVTTQASAERLVANLAYFSNEIGALKGQKIGIFDADGDFREAVTMGLIPVLKSLGYNITDEETISATDVNEIPPQAQVAVENMRSKGVTTVLMVHNFLADSLFVQDADKQLYHPQYLESEWGGLMGPGSTNEMPQSFQGAIGFYGGNEDTQQASAPVPVGDEQCAAIYNSTQSPGNQFGPGTGGFDGLMGGCNMLNIFVAAARNVGPDLTRQAWAGAVGHLGSFTMDGGPPASFGTEYGIKAWSPLKDDGSDYVREVTWQYSCTCWLPVGKSSFVRDAY